MAYDPEARETSNNAMIIGVVALVLVVLGALAYYATRPTDTVVTQPVITRVEKTTEVVPATPPSTTVITPPATSQAPATPPSTTTRTDITVNTPPAANPAPRGNAAPPGDRTNTTIVNNAPPAATPPATPPPGDGAGNSTSAPAPGY